MPWISAKWRETDLCNPTPYYFNTKRNSLASIYATKTKKKLDIFEKNTHYIMYIGELWKKVCEKIYKVAFAVLR